MSQSGAEYRKLRAFRLDSGDRTRVISQSARVKARDRAGNLDAMPAVKRVKIK